MSWVSIDQDNCNQCGLCITRCPSCYSEVDGIVEVDANELTCITCGHCVSVCAKDAITHHKMDMENFPSSDRSAVPDSESFERFLRGRRSHRHFTKKPIPRSELERLVDICRYAPTGSNRQGVEIKIIENTEKIKLLSDLTVDYFMDMIESIEGRVHALESEGQEVPQNLRQLASTMGRYKSMGAARDVGLDVILRGAPCVMIFHSSTRTSTTPKDDCVIAAQTVSMLAMTMKLQSCYIGLLTASAKAHQPVIDALALPPGNEIQCVLIVGHPKLRYLRAVDRKPMKVTWE